MRRSAFRRPQIERKPVVLTRIAPQDRRGVMARIDQAARKAWNETRPKPSPARRRSRDAATQAHFDRLFGHGCIACWLLYGTHVDPQIHHPREFAGGGERADDWLAIPLCQPHHTGSGGVHGDRSVLRQLGYTSEAPLLAITLRRVYG